MQVGRDYVAYQEIGDSGPALIYIPQWFMSVEALWDVPELADFVERLATFARVVMFDKRGTGVSDPPSSADSPFLEQFAEDVGAVMAVTEMESATLVCGDSAGLLGIAFSATYPQRVRALVLVNAYCRAGRDVDYPFGLSQQDIDASPGVLLDQWLHAERLDGYMPSAANDPRAVSRVQRFARRSGSPRVSSETRRELYGLDVTGLLPSVQAPTLVLHRSDDPVIEIGHGRYLAAHIPNAKLVELDGQDHLHYFGDAGGLLDEIEEFVTGQRRPLLTDRVVATVLFVDLVASTESVASLGDRRWRSVLDDYDRAVDTALTRFQGNRVKSTGDGTLATFDGPGRALRCAATVRDAVQRQGLEVRVGLHTGEIEVRGTDVAGIAVHIAQRVQSSAEPGEILVSRTVVDLVAGSGTPFEDRGEHELKGVPGLWRLFAVQADRRMR